MKINLIVAKLVFKSKIGNNLECKKLKASRRHIGLLTQVVITSRYRDFQFDDNIQNITFALTQLYFYGRAYRPH